MIDANRSREIRQAWALLSPSARLPFYLAVFSTFASIGLLTDMLGHGSQASGWLLGLVLWSGLFAVGIAWCVMSERLPILPLLALLQVAVARALPAREPLAGDALSARITLDAAGTIILVIGGYAFFAHFISREVVGALRVRTEVALARGIHEQVVPDVDSHLGRFHALGRARPATEVGGDLFDVVRSGDGLIAYLADVTGHGVPAGMLSGMTKAAARMRLMGDTDLTHLLGDLHSVLSPLKSSAMFVTCSAVQIDSRGRCRVALAGHPPVLLFAARSGTVERLGEAGLPLGVAEWRWESARIDLETGDVLVLVSDGLTEVFDAADREFGLAGVERTLAANGRRPLADLCDAIFAAAAEHGAQHDDQTLLLVRLFEPDP